MAGAQGKACGCPRAPPSCPRWTVGVSRALWVFCCTVPTPLLTHSPQPHALPLAAARLGLPDMRLNTNVSSFSAGWITIRYSRRGEVGTAPLPRPRPACEAARRHWTPAPRPVAGRKHRWDVSHVSACNFRRTDLGLATAAIAALSIFVACRPLLAASPHSPRPLLGAPPTPNLPICSPIL